MLYITHIAVHHSCLDNSRGKQTKLTQTGSAFNSDWQTEWTTTNKWKLCCLRIYLLAYAMLKNNERGGIRVRNRRTRVNLFFHYDQHFDIYYYDACSWQCMYAQIVITLITNSTKYLHSHELRVVEKFSLLRLYCVRTKYVNNFVWYNFECEEQVSSIPRRLVLYGLCFTMCSVSVMKKFALESKMTVFGVIHTMLTSETYGCLWKTSERTAATWQRFFHSIRLAHSASGEIELSSLNIFNWKKHTKDMGEYN